MQICATYSHLNGLENLQLNHSEVWNEIEDVIANIDAKSCKTKVSKEIKRKGKKLFSPIKLNSAFKSNFSNRGWEEMRIEFYTTDDASIISGIYDKSPMDQKLTIESKNKIPLHTYNQIDFLKDKVAVEVQFGKYSFVAHDLFVKFMSFFASPILLASAPSL